MSVQAISWALDQIVLNATEKAILLVLANYANEYGVSWPSQKTLAVQSACTDRTIRTVLRRFEARGLVRRMPRRRGNGSRRSDIILLAAFKGRKPAPPGLLDGEGEDQCEQPEELSDRNGFPGGHRNAFPHPPEPGSALEPSKILKSASLYAHADHRMACLAVAGPGFDREAEARGMSSIEIARWIEAGCDLAHDILPVIAAKTRDPRPAPIRGWAFFTPAILEAKALREAPLREPEEQCNERDRKHRRASKRDRSVARDYRDAWDAAIAELDREGAARAAAGTAGRVADRRGGEGTLRLAYSRDAQGDREPD